MSLENNRKDFERALSEMTETINTMETCVDDALLDTLRAVITEYEGHYVGDIDDLISERDDLQKKINDADL